MRISVDIKKLIVKLQAFNPEADLTGVKAYLLDLALGEGMVEEVQERVQESYAPPTVESSRVEKTVSTELPPGLLGDLSSSSSRKASTISTPTIKINRGGKSDKETKSARLDEIKKMTEMSSKDLMKQITKQYEKKVDGNQIVDEGVEEESSYGGGDLEIG